MTAAFQQRMISLISLQTEHDMTWLQALIGAIRNIRGEMKAWQCGASACATW